MIFLLATVLQKGTDGPCFLSRSDACEIRGVHSRQCPARYFGVLNKEWSLLRESKKAYSQSVQVFQKESNY